MIEVPGSSKLGMEGMTMAWFYLSLAGCFEVVRAVGLKYTVGFTKFWPSAGTLAPLWNVIP